jgi:hypothetical protein
MCQAKGEKNSDRREARSDRDTSVDEHLFGRSDSLLAKRETPAHVGRETVVSAHRRRSGIERGYAESEGVCEGLGTGQGVRCGCGCMVTLTVTVTVTVAVTVTVTVAVTVAVSYGYG